MEILFIWLLRYKNFEKQGFNFSSEYIFNVEKKGPDNYELAITKNESFIPDFFEKPNILNVTAIIGQNGTGKSNILEFIKTSFPEGYSSIQSQAIIAYRSSEDKDRKILLIPNNSFAVSVVQDDEYFEILKYPFDMPKEASGLFYQDYSTAEYIYYSNTFDLRAEVSNMAGMHNLSTLALLKADTGEQNEAELYVSGGSYDSFRANEIRRNIQFILSDYTNLLENFPLPEYLFIEVLDSDLKYFQKDKNEDVQNALRHFEAEQSAKNLAPEIRFLNKLYVAVFLNFLTTDREFASLGGFIKNISVETGDTIKSYITNFFKELPEIKYQDSIPIDNHEKKSKFALQFFEYIEKLLKKKSFEVTDNGSLNRSTIKYPVKPNALEELTHFLKLYINLKGLTDFLDFNWRNLSSGEQSLFSFISRFYHLKHHQIQHEDLRKNMVILIDEGDIYFHPDWQRKFFKLAIDYLSALFKDHSLQLIFTANTPFMTSDLPKSNIIFIEKKGKRKVVVHGVENDREDTFGGNIHTLYADSFYLEGALIGEFAKEKINEIIRYLQSESREIKGDYKKVIDILGEPVLKRKLLEMWFNKFGDDKEIVELEKRIRELRKKKHD